MDLFVKHSIVVVRSDW